MNSTKNCNSIAMAMRMLEQQVNNALVQSNHNSIQMEQQAIRQRLNELISTVGRFV